jgi:hypothetical protein
LKYAYDEWITLYRENAAEREIDELLKFFLCAEYEYFKENWDPKLTVVLSL